MSDPFAPIGGGKPNGHAPAPASPQWTLIAPVPPDAPSPPSRHSKLGAYSARWTYRAASGDVLGYVLRFDGADGKQFRPLALYAPAEGGAPVWRWEAWPVPRPLYGLDRLAERPSAFIVVCEGEKSADAASRLLPDFVCVTSPNGSKSAAKADWSALRGRDVTVWRDADEPGLEYARAVAAFCYAAGAASVAIVATPGGVKEGWDAADAEAQGWTPARALDLVGAAEPIERPAAESAKKGKQKKERRARQRDVFMELTRDCVLWHGPDYEGFVTFPVKDHMETWSLRCSAFRRFLSSRAYEAHGVVPGGQALEDVTRVLEARAVSEGEQRAPWRRVGARDGCLYIDLADAEWRAVKITATGRKLLDAHDLPFVRSPRMRALCSPLGGYSIGEIFRPFANVAHDDDFLLIVAWLVASFRERGPYPILVLNGEQGSGKSSFARRLRSLLDPSSPPIQGPPKDEQALIVTAQNSHLIALDNLSHVSPELSDGLCRLSTGGGFAVRALHTDKDENIFDGARPIIVNGIPSLADRPDLNERAIIVRLATIPEDKRRPEDDLDEEWERARPYVLGAICAALSSALRNIGTTKLARSGRMADFEKWTRAAEPGLGWEAGTFSRAYASNRRDNAEAAFESDIIAVAIRDFMVQECSYFWSGTATELLNKLGLVVGETTRQMRVWPKTAQAIGNCLERCAPLLRCKGITIERKHSGVRVINISRVRESDAPASQRDDFP